VVSFLHQKATGISPRSFRLDPCPEYRFIDLLLLLLRRRLQRTKRRHGLPFRSVDLGRIDASHPRSGRFADYRLCVVNGHLRKMLVKEELAVGKTTSERRYRIRTYVVETPVEEQVKLRDERVIVERRPASGTVGSDAGVAMQERVFEVTERREEPVVEKRAREAEEVVVRKEADERVETVRDTVRETKVDVDRGPADRRQNIGSTTPPNRNP
jgi:hypothetical protein